MPVPRVVILDRSLLAINMLRLLLTPMDMRIVPASNLHDAQLATQGREPLGLVIINSNILGEHFNRQLDWLCDEPGLAKIPKIFLCRDLPSEGEQREILARVPAARVITRPFYPPEFLTIVTEILGHEGGGDRVAS